MSRSRPQPVQMRIEELAEATGATVRNIRVYQEKGLLPAPTRKGRTAMYGQVHLRRLQAILRLLDRGYTFATIDELFAAERLGLSLGDLIESDDPKTNRKVGRRRMYTRADAEEVAGFTFSEEIVRIGAEGGVVQDPDGEKGYLTDAHLYALFRDLVELGLTEEEIDRLAVITFESQQQASEAFDILVEGIRRHPAHRDSSDEQVFEVVMDLLPRSAAATRVIYQTVVEHRLRENLGLPRNR